MKRQVEKKITETGYHFFFFKSETSQSSPRHFQLTGPASKYTAHLRSVALAALQVFYFPWHKPLMNHFSNALSINKLSFCIGKYFFPPLWFHLLNQIFLCVEPLEGKQVWDFPLITAFPRSSPAVSGARVPCHTFYFVESFHFTTFEATGGVYWSFHTAVLFLQEHWDGYSLVWYEAPCFSVSGGRGGRRFLRLRVCGCKGSRKCYTTGFSFTVKNVLVWWISKSRELALPNETSCDT